MFHMSRNQQHRRKRQKQLYLIALLLCLAVLGFSVWLLFIPNTLNRAGESSALQNSTSDSSNAAGTNALDTPSNIDAQGFLAVLEGSTAQLPTADVTLPLQKWTAAVLLLACSRADARSPTAKLLTRSPCGSWNSGRREPM